MLSASPIWLTEAYTPSSSSFCHRHARASALTSVPSGCGFDAGTISMPSGAIPLQRLQAGHGLMLHRSNGNHPMAGANASAVKIACTAEMLRFLNETAPVLWSSPA
jgi:hypothetical protein